MVVLISNIDQDIEMEEVRCYFQDKLGCKVDIAGDILLGSLDDDVVRDYTKEVLVENSKKWLKDIFAKQDYNWND